MKLTDRKGFPSKGKSLSNKKRFASVDHLTVEAVAAFVDGELSAGATHRAKIHLVHCAECRADVAAQRRAAEALRSSEQQPICAPSALIAKLTNIADAACEQTAPQHDTTPSSVAKIFTALSRNKRS
ncbi:anti-sigma factor family protein [Corynebacterium aquilae]|uniref:anti-sigma factor family protein n=1 Tax=Corynebacterium aquilae TaxID=203263 RepID=UPI0009523940|nr:zf-HC2 domain-containing protein [Corynebacterium aquilae]